MSAPALLAVAEVHALLAGRAEFDLGDLPPPPRIQARNSHPGLAVIRVTDILTSSPSILARMLGALSLQDFTAALKQAHAWPQVSRILIDMDSPGGETRHVPEAAALMRDIRRDKPIHVAVNAHTSGTAYWLASQATEIAVTPSGEVGGVGVHALHSDRSAALERRGEKITFVHAGRYKTEANPFEPLSPEARAHIQRTVDGVHEKMLRDLAVGRGLHHAKIRKDFGEGRTVSATEALARGMADRVEPFTATLARVAKLADRDARFSDSRSGTRAARWSERFK